MLFPSELLSMPVSAQRCIVSRERRGGGEGGGTASSSGAAKLGRAGLAGANGIDPFPLSSSRRSSLLSSAPRSEVRETSQRMSEAIVGPAARTWLK